MVQLSGSTDCVHLFAAVDHVQLQVVSAAQRQDSQGYYKRWASQDNHIDCTSKDGDIVHILAAPSFVDKGNSHMLTGWGGIERVVFDLANKPAEAVGEDKAVHN